MNVSPADSRPFGFFEPLPDGIIRAAHEAIVTVDDEQRIVMINPAAQRMFGCTAQQALGSDLSRFIPVSHRKAHADHVREFSESGATERPMSMRARITGLRASGEEFPVEAAISRVEVAGALGPKHFYTALLRDLSEEQALKEQVETERRRFRLVFDLAPIAIWITDNDRIVFANRACAELFGRDSGSDSLLGESIFALLHPDSHAPLRPLLERAMADADAKPVVQECLALTNNGQRKVEIALAGLPGEGRTAVQMVISDLTQRNEERLALERSRHDLRQLSANVVQAREEERRRIARELHDELGQRLSALKMDLASLEHIADRPAHEERKAAMLEMLDETVTSVRRIAADLRPMMLDDLGLNAALEWLARESARRMGIEVTFHLGERDPALDKQASVTVYRMVQEALTNVARHAGATDVRIEMRQAGGQLVLTVRDNGVGFPASATRKEGSFGLMGIRERAYLLGGTLEVDNPPGGGGRITVRLPLRSSGEGDTPSTSP